MFCKYCGNELPDEANFCVRCGKLNETAELGDEGTIVVQPLVCNEVPQSQQEDPQRQEREAMGGQLLKLSILGLAFSITCWLSAVGLVFAILARRKLNLYEKTFGGTEGRATVGKHLSVAALIISVALLAVSVITVLAPLITLLIDRLMQ